jgi:hypothetical protein
VWPLKTRIFQLVYSKKLDLKKKTRLCVINYAQYVCINGAEHFAGIPQLPLLYGLAYKKLELNLRQKKLHEFGPV